MNRIADRIRSDYPENLKKRDEKYRNPCDLNISDPSNAAEGDGTMKDFNEGYEKDPYSIRQFATKQKGLIKTADEETVIMKFSPDFLADRILTLWNGADGPLQNFYDLFTLRYDNKMKMDIAKLLKEQGYMVYPTLIDDKPRYANNKKQMKTILASVDPISALEMGKEFFKESEGVRLLLGEINDLKEHNYAVSNEEVGALLGYYLEIYHDDDALKTIKSSIDNQLKKKLKL